MDDRKRGQVTTTAAEVYEEFFLPALFEQWAPRLVDAAEIRTGQRVLDVACGTGVLARAAADRVGRDGSIVGLDVNEGMLAVAERAAPHIEWRRGVAESLPFDSDDFDAVVCQFGLMFFDDPRAAIGEMARVARPGGRLAVAVWDSLDHTPGYAAATDLLQRLFGDDAADALRAPYTLGSPEVLRSLFEDAGVPEPEITTVAGTARFPSIRSWMYTDVRGWTLADMIDDARFDRLLEEAERELRSFVDQAGKVAFDAPAHLVTAVKP